MRIRILSDIHLETYNGKYDEKHHHKNPSYDKLINIINAKIKHIHGDEVLMLPGDLGYVLKEGTIMFNPEYENFLRFCKSKWNYIVIVPGNTEYHGMRSFESIIETEKALKIKCEEIGIYFLQKGVIKIDEYYIIGCTLWSYITRKEWKNLKEQDKDIFMNMDIYRRMYIDNLEWLDSVLSVIKSKNEKAIVITHYPPITEDKSVTFKVENKEISHIDKFIFLYQDTIKIWVCGHIHDKNYMEIFKIPIYTNTVGESFEEHKESLKMGLITI